jgi:transposase
MTKKRKPYKTCSKEFKLEAIRLMEQSERPASEIAKQLGIRRNQLYKWKEAMKKTGDAPATKNGPPRKKDRSEITRLRQDLKRIKEENEILQKAAAFFVKALD